MTNERWIRMCNMKENGVKFALNVTEDGRIAMDAIYKDGRRVTLFYMNETEAFPYADLLD